MAEDLQSLLEKINRDGIEKAEAEAAKILADAKNKASALVDDARAEAEKFRAAAKKDAEDYAARAAETIRQAARDTVIAVQDAVTKLLTKILTEDVDAALSDPKIAAGLACGAIQDIMAPAEVAANSKLVAALKAQLAAKPTIQVATDDTLGTGFSVRIDGGRIEHAFTGPVIAEELAKRLRPDLAALVK